jgi:hypothetical protein
MLVSIFILAGFITGVLLTLLWQFHARMLRKAHYCDYILQGGVGASKHSSG